MHRWPLQAQCAIVHSTFGGSCVTRYHMAGKRKPLPPVVGQLQVFVEQRRACEDTQAVHVVISGCFLDDISFSQTHVPVPTQCYCGVGTE